MHGTKTDQDEKEGVPSRWQAFQIQLLERIKDARQGGRLAHSKLAVMVGKHHCLFDLAHTQAVMMLPVLTPVPLVKPWFMGVANIRGTLLGVVDYGLLSGLGEQMHTSENRLVLPEKWREYQTGLLVEKVLGVQSIERMTEHEVTLELPGAVRACTDETGRVWTELDWDALLSDSRFQQVDLYSRKRMPVQGSRT